MPQSPLAPFCWARTAACSIMASCPCIGHWDLQPIGPSPRGLLAYFPARASQVFIEHHICKVAAEHLVKLEHVWYGLYWLAPLVNNHRNFAGQSTYSFVLQPSFAVVRQNRVFAVSSQTMYDHQRSVGILQNTWIHSFAEIALQIPTAEISDVIYWRF